MQGTSLNRKKKLFIPELNIFCCFKKCSLKKFSLEILFINIKNYFI